MRVAPSLPGEFVSARLETPTRKSDSTLCVRQFSSLEEKWDILCKECVGGQLRGGSAKELLTVGGDRHLLWVDLDCRDEVLQRADETLKRVWPEGSFRLVPSSTGRGHLFVSVDGLLPRTCLKELNAAMKRILPEGSRVDRVASADTVQTLYLPYAAQGRATLPQALFDADDPYVTLASIMGVEHG